MKTVEEYAIELVVEGAESLAQDDLNEDDEPLSDEDWRAATKLAIAIAQAIRDNPRTVLALVGR